MVTKNASAMSFKVAVNSQLHATFSTQNVPRMNYHALTGITIGNE